MWTPGVVELDPVPQDPAGMLQTMNGRLFERPDQSLDHPILFWMVENNKLLF